MKKVIKITLLVLAVLLIALISIPFLFKDKILAKVKTEINNNVNAKVYFTEFGLTVFRNFPNLTVRLDGLHIVGIDDFDGDTLAVMSSAGIVVDIMSVISGDKIQIRSIQLDDPRINLLVLADGKANWDIAKPSDDPSQAADESSEFDIGLKKYTIKNGFLVYNDVSSGMKATLNGLNHTGSGDFTQDLFLLDTKTEVALLNFVYGGVSYLYNVKTKLDADLEMDMVNSKYTFKQNELNLNELIIGFDGFIAMPTNDITIDITFEARKNEFKNFMSMVPGVYRDGFDKVKSSGTMQFDGFVKGTYSENTMPGFNLNLIIDNGNFQYSELPVGVNNVSLNLNVTNPDGVPDNTVINLSQLHVELGKDPFDARLIVKTPVSDADIDATVVGRVDMANIKNLVPLEAGTEISGVFAANITAKGRMSSIDNKQYDQFNAKGDLVLTNVNYKSNDLKQGVQINSCELIFNPKNVTLNKFDMKSGRTDIRATGWIDNMLTYAFKENELLKGTLDIKSNIIDLNELSGESSTEKDPESEQTPTEVFEVPENIDFLITAAVGQIFYDDLVLANANGNVAIRDRSLGINDFSFNVLDGKVSMDGLYETKDIRKPSIFFNLNLAGLDIKKTYDSFIAVQKFAPIAERSNGKFSSSMSVKGDLDQKMEPVMTSLNGSGRLSTNNVVIENFPPLVKVADAIKMDQFKKMNVSDVNLSFKFENGRVNIDPFDVNIAGIKSTVYGSNGFDETIDYTMALKIPTSMMGGAATTAVSGLLAQANKAAGSNLSMGKEVSMNVKMTGTVSDPKIETNIKDMAGDVVTDVKEQIKEQFEDKKQELEDKARNEADRLKKEAEAEADRLKKEAEAKAKAEADRLKKEAEERAKKEAESKLKDLFGKPKK